MSAVKNAHRQELYNRERREGWRGGKRGREREIFFHCMPAAALISWSILVNSFTGGDRPVCH